MKQHATVMPSHDWRSLLPMLSIFLVSRCGIWGIQVKQMSFWRPGLARKAIRWWLMPRRVEKASCTRPTGGEDSSGLGLSICKRIVDLHGGHIDVTSEYGSGTTFSVKLPL